MLPLLPPPQGVLSHHGFVGFRVVPEEEVQEAVVAAARAVRAAGSGSRAFDALQLFLRVPEQGGLGAACDLLADATARLAPQPLLEAQQRLQQERQGAAAATVTQDATPSPPLLHGGAPRDAWLQYAAWLLDSKLVAAGPAAADRSAAGGDRLHAVAVGVNLCRVFDELQAGQAEAALVLATEAGLIPAGGDGTGQTAQGDWRGIFDRLPLPAQEAYGALLPGLMRATAALWAAGVQDAVRANPGLAPGRLLLDAIAAGGDAGSYQQQQQFGAAGAASIERLRRVRALARRLASGHSPMMRRMLPAALLGDLAAAESALAA